MNFQNYKSKLSNLVEQRNTYVLLAAGALFICFMLLVLVFNLSDRQRIVVVPANVDHSFWVSESQVSSEYLSEMSTFFAYLRLNTTPDSVRTQQEMLLRYTAPSAFGALKDQLIAERDHIESQKISTAFFPVNVVVDTKNLSSIVVGDLSASVGTTPLPIKRVAYQIDYRYDDGRLYVVSFQSINPNDLQLSPNAVNKAQGGK